MNITKRLLSLMIFAGLIFMSSFSFASAIEFGGIGGKPTITDPNNDLTKTWFIYEIEPGEIKSDSITVHNFTDRSETILVYPSDSTPSSDGGFALKQRVEAMEEIGSWVEIETSRLTLQPGESVVIPFKVNVPQNAEVGEHRGGIMIEREKSEETQAVGGVTLSLRVGVRMYVTIPGTIIKKLILEGVEIMKNESLENEWNTTVSIENEGNVSRIAKVDVYINNLFFKNKSQTFSRNSVEVLRGDHKNSNFAWKPPYFSRVMAYTVIEYEGQNGTEKLTSDPVYAWIIPWGDIGLAFLALGIAFVVGIIWHYLERMYIAKKWASYPVSSGDTIEKLSIILNMSVKHIASANRIKKPYSLSGKTSILIPPKKISMAQYRKDLVGGTEKVAPEVVEEEVEVMVPTPATKKVVKKQPVKKTVKKSGAKKKTTK